MNQLSDPKIPFGIYALMVSAFFASMSQIGQITIIGKQVWDMTGNELDLGLIGVAEFLPVALLAPITGSIADRFDRRRVCYCSFRRNSCFSSSFSLHPK